MRPIWQRIFEALVEDADHTAQVVAGLDRKLDHLRQQNSVLLRLVRQLLEQTPDPAQVAALGEEIAKLEGAAAQATEAMAANLTPKET
jgi:hypothetical protein